MAKSVSIHNTNGHLSCSICQQTFSEMTLSSCFHTFCPDCLHGQFGSSRYRTHYECPICQTPIRLPTASRSNSNLESDIEKYQIGYEGPAYSSRTGETTCDICSDSKPATTECLQCQEMFCESCTNAHLKMRSSRYHGEQVVPLRKNGDENISKFCPRHQNQEILFICKKCNVLVCMICKLMEHENHVTKLVSEEAKDIRQNLSSLLRNRTVYMDNLQVRLRMMNDKKNQYPNELEQELEKVRYQATKMHQTIEQEKTEAEKELAQHYNSYIDKANESSNHMKHEYEKNSAMHREAQQLLETSNDVNLVQHGSYLCRKLQQTDPDHRGSSGKEPEQPYKIFVPGTISDQNSQRLVGIVTETSNVGTRPLYSAKSVTASPTRPMYSATSRQSEHYVPVPQTRSDPVQLSNISAFNIPFTDGIGYIYGIAPIVSRQQAWITMLDSNFIKLVDQEGNVLNSVNLGEPCEGVTSDGEGGCFVTCPGSKSVYHVNNSCEINPILVNLSQDPHGISGWQYFESSQKTLIEELYICLTDTQGSTVSQYDQDTAKGRVGVFSFLGQDLDRSFSVQSPVRIDVSLETKMICVSDHTNGCVIVCDKSGKYITALYTGEDDNELFKPLGVCFDETGHVIIADWTGGKVSRISQDGRLVQHLLTGLDGPQSVAIGDEGMLWVGTKQGKVSVYKIN